MEWGEQVAIVTGEAARKPSGVHSHHPRQQRRRGLAGHPRHLRPRAGCAHAPGEHGGVIHATRAVMGSMRTWQYGRIVNLSSIAAIGTALPGNAFYAATKAGVAVLTRRFAMELGSYGITVNAVAPGFVRADMTQGGRGAADWQGTEERLGARAMMGRIGATGGRR